MVDIFTQLPMQSQSEMDFKECPRKKTLDFVRQFARVYTNLGIDSEIGGLIVN